jgi:aminoglycoside phosphotransferase (APT) family kinase protein
MTEAEDLVDRTAVRAFLADRLGPAERFDIERHDQGLSNETLFVTWGERDLVLRRPPPGDTAETAHDVLREYEVLDALQGSAVPVPGTVTATDETGVIGCPFYVMERLDGDVIRFSEPDRFDTPVARRRVGHQLVDTLAAIHAVDYEAVGLGEFGRPERFTERQVERWSEQFEWAFQETTAERAVPAIETVGEWLAANVPDTRADTLVHGDYKLDNVLFAPGTPPQIAGVLDWEMSTLGDPLCDLGWMLFFWLEDGADSSALMQTMGPTFLGTEGYPSRADLVARYERQTGITVENLTFYRVLAVYKMAALGEMFFARYLMGHSDSSFYAMMEDGVPVLADQALSLIESDETL